MPPGPGSPVARLIGTLAATIVVSAVFSAAQSLTGPPAPDVPLPSQALEQVADEAQLRLTAVPELLVELEKRAAAIRQTISRGALNAVWVPAMETKTAAIVLERHVSELPDARRPAAVAAIKQIVVSAWKLDAYGDMGNRARVDAGYSELANAVSKLKAVYAGP